MSDESIIALAAVVITGLGLILNYFETRRLASEQRQFQKSQGEFQADVQIKLADMQNDADLAKEQRQYILSDQHQDLLRISRWLGEGFRLASEISSLGTWYGIIKVAGTPGASERWDTDRQRVSAEVEKFYQEYSTVRMLAVQYDHKPGALAAKASGEVTITFDVDEYLAGLTALVEAVGDEVSKANKHVGKHELESEDFSNIAELTKSWWLRGNQLIEARREAFFARKSKG